MATNVKINFITGSAAKVNLTSSNIIKATIKDRGPVGPIGLGITEQNIGFTLTGGITPKTLTVALDANVSGTNSGDSSGHSGLATIDNPTFTTGVTTPAIKITTGAAANKVLTSDADGDATWESPATSLSVTTKGDLQTFSTVADRLPIGVDGKVLKANASTATGLEWGDAGTSSPLTTKGDLYGFDTVNQRIPIGTDGQVLTADSTDDQGLSWKNASATADVISEVPTGTPNGTLTDFTIIQSPITGTLRVFVNGVRQKVTDDYTFTGTTITFVSAPLTDSKILVDYKINSGDFSTGSASWINNETPSGTVDGSNQTFTLASTPVTGSLYLFRDGQLMTGGGADYTLTTNSIAFVTAPVTGSVLLAFYQSAVSTAGNADLLDGKHANELVPLTAKGDLETHDGSTPARLPVGTDGYVLESRASETTGLRWVTPATVSTDGWISAGETWTYASASTITVPSGAASKYAVGDRIRWKQGAGYKYGVLTAVADTVLTIAVNTDFTVATPTAITDNYYSHEASPIGYPTWFNFAAPTMVYQEFDDGSGGQPNISIRRYCITGKLCTVKMYGSGVKAGTGFYCGTFSQSALPQIKTDYITGRTVCGTAYIWPNAENPIVGIIMAYTNGAFYALFHTNITDNTVVANWSIMMSYEI